MTNCSSKTSCGFRSSGFLTFLLFLTLLASPHVAVAASVGMVTKIQNQAQVGSTPAGVGTVVNMNDVLLTGPGGRMEVTFRDKTTLVLGENARVVIDRYVFNPEASTGALILNTSGAAYRLATGRLSEMQNKKITVNTPVASLGVRGTEFWWGPVENYYGVLLVHNSSVAVSNRFGSATLNRAGWGTDIRPGSAPGRPYQWPPGKINNALPSTAFNQALGIGGWTTLAIVAGAATAVVIVATEPEDVPTPPPTPISP
jgi:hypothetical protein